MYVWGVALGLNAICWRWPAHSTTNSLLSHKNISSYVLHEFDCTTPGHSHSFPHYYFCVRFPPVSLLHSPEKRHMWHKSMTLCHKCVSSEWVGKTWTQTRSSGLIETPGEFGLCLISSGKPAVYAPPTYKCTCSSQSHKSNVFLLHQWRHVLQIPAWWAATHQIRIYHRI